MIKIWTLNKKTLFHIHFLIQPTRFYVVPYSKSTSREEAVDAPVNHTVTPESSGNVDSDLPPPSLSTDTSASSLHNSNLAANDRLQSDDSDSQPSPEPDLNGLNIRWVMCNIAKCHYTTKYKKFSESNRICLKLYVKNAIYFQTLTLNRIFFCMRAKHNCH